MSDQYYEDLAASLTDESVPVTSAGKVKTGAAAAADGRAFLLAEYGSEDAIRMGRPHVGAEKGGKSPVVRGAIPRSEFELLEGLRAKTGRSQSELVREAVHLLLERHKLAG
ncbi:ribbon-helix-helix protein, CopG family [Arthrobacter sp. B2a2-09]|uniref:ribbon-helix-helix protein, CopG family n=1 Tax=Arthrobacter sp. B2a2-09 TaxID=2952822 RepID=UPI0022CD6E46|nr:ribbon-helix-helix protein, CopG family [Arthrobacter sp. B2a2-09]MCZ9882169.1 ribbon-helix-helix protein, CopG family [Arthrobacter sp. B2a2-09]